MKKTVFSVATLTALTGTSLTANAEEVIVKEGDTLWGIANEVGTTVEKLKELNNLNSDLIHPEDVLTYEVEAVEENNGNTYTVKAGDTLWQIALDHGMDLDELFAVNNLSSDLIHPGLVLTVGSQVEAVEEVEEVVEVEAVEEVVEPVVEENEVNEVASGVYHIQAGDTLYSISRATGLSVDELKALNGLTSDHIVAGDVLVLEGNPVVTEEVQEVQTEEVAEVVEEVTEVENNVQAEAEKAVQEAAAAQAEADRIAAEAAAAAQAEAERVAAEQVAAAQKAEEQRIAAERAEAQRVAKEKAAAEKRAQQEAAKQVQQAQQAQQAEQAQQNQAASAPALNTSQRFAGETNHYVWGWCAWYVFEKRAQIGAPIGGVWGNANDWVSVASSLGYTVNNTPSVGSIAHSYAGANGAGGYGHVAVVESVNGDGSITVSEMGWNGGVGVVNYRTIPASQVSSHNFIH